MVARARLGMSFWWRVVHDTTGEWGLSSLKMLAELQIYHRLCLCSLRLERCREALRAVKASGPLRRVSQKRCAPPNY
jgi:hypothetical protein